MKLEDLFESHAIVIDSIQIKEISQTGSVSWDQLKNVEMYINSTWVNIGFKIDIVPHFFRMMNSSRNVKNISIKEIRDLFNRVRQQYGNQLQEFSDKTQRKEAVIIDLKTNINIPIAIKWDDQNNIFDLITKTVIRKKGYRTKNTTFVVR